MVLDTKHPHHCHPFLWGREGKIQDMLRNLTKLLSWELGCGIFLSLLFLRGSLLFSLSENSGLENAAEMFSGPCFHWNFYQLSLSTASSSSADSAQAGAISQRVRGGGLCLKSCGTQGQEPGALCTFLRRQPELRTAMPTP